jgi:hypothetical protein
MKMRRNLGAADGYRSLAGRLPAALGRHGPAVPPITMEAVAAIERDPGGKITPVKRLAPGTGQLTPGEGASGT